MKKKSYSKKQLEIIDRLTVFLDELDFGKEKWGKIDKRPIRTLDHVWRELERDD